MTDRFAAARLWADTLAEPTEDRRAELDGSLAEGITSSSPLGTTEGREEVLASLGASPIAPLFAQGRWSEPAVEGDTVTVSCTFPPAAPIGGVSVALTFDGADRVTRAETTIIPSPPPEPKPIDLSGPVADALAGALANGTPVTVAYVDSGGRPHLSLRGSTQALDAQRAAIWVRDPQGGIVRAVPGNPHVALFYRDPATRTSYQVSGRARIEADEAVRDAVYSASPEPERNLDPQQRGVAVVIDVDRVEGRDAGGPVLMVRA